MPNAFIREREREWILNNTSAHSRLYSVIHVVYDLHTMESRQIKMTDDRLQKLQIRKSTEYILQQQ